MTDVDHQELANRFAAGLSRGDLGVIDEIYAEDAVEEFPQSGERFRGRASIRGVLERAASEFASGERGPDLSTVEGHGSDEHRVLAAARRAFGASNMDQVATREFPLPGLLAKSQALAQLVTDGLVNLRRRGSRLLWKLTVWRCRKS